MGQLDGRRVLVVGASRGLGHAFVGRLLSEGARVAAAARSLPTVDDRTGDFHAFTCDVRAPEQCAGAVASAADALGGLDALVYAPGTTVITELRAATAEHWRTVLETNVVGASLVTAAVMPHLEASKGVAVYLSSVSAHVTPPWVGMGLYAASKVALEKMAEVWKLEHPEVRVTTMVIGSTSGGSFFASAEAPNEDDLGRFGAEWHARGYLAEEQLTPDDQADALVAVLAGRAQIDVMWVRPRRLFQRWGHDDA